MRESSLVPTNILSWPRVEPLTLRHKFILVALWSAPWMSSAGCGELPLHAFSTSLSIDVDDVREGIQTLAEEGLILFDDETNELAICDWVRFHKFKTVVSLRILRSEISKIRSTIIRENLTEKFSGCSIATKNSNVDSESVLADAIKQENPMPHAKTDSSPESISINDSGLIIKNIRDVIAAKRLEEEFGHEKVKEVSGSMPVPYASSVRKRLEVRYST